MVPYAHHFPHAVHIAPALRLRDSIYVIEQKTKNRIAEIAIGDNVVNMSTKLQADEKRVPEPHMVWEYEIRSSGLPQHRLVFGVQSEFGPQPQTERHAYDREKKPTVFRDVFVVPGYTLSYFRQLDTV